MNIQFDIDRIRKFIDDKNTEMLLTSPKRKLLYSTSHFARENGIKKITLNCIMRYEQIPSLSNAYLIAKGMGLKIDDLIIRK